MSTVHAQFDAHTGILPCCNTHYLERLFTGDQQTDQPSEVTCGKGGD